MWPTWEILWKKKILHSIFTFYLNTDASVVKFSLALHFNKNGDHPWGRCWPNYLESKPSLNCWSAVERAEITFISIHINANQNQNIIVQFMMSANIRIRFGLQIVLVCLYSTPSHYNHCANLSEGIELINCLLDLFCRVCKIKHIISVIHYTICGAVSFQFTHLSCDDDCENIYTLSYYHHQIGSMNYYPLFRVRSWNNGVRCMSFYILMTIN